MNCVTIRIHMCMHMYFTCLNITCTLCTSAKSVCMSYRHVAIEKKRVRDESQMRAKIVPVALEIEDRAYFDWNPLMCLKGNDDLK